MRFSIIIPSWNNYEYLKICINSIKKNSSISHDIKVHLNEGNDGSKDFLLKNKIQFTQSEKNIGMCSAVNSASKLSETDYILYAHDDMYFLPEWDIFLKDEIKKMSTNLFYLSGTTIGPLGAGLQTINNFKKYINKNKQITNEDLKKIDFNCGKTYETFNEKKVLEEYKKISFYDHQGSHWAPHLVHKTLWNKIGGFSQEFNPGFASDTDLNMKLWKEGVRIFKGINKFRVYHFGSISIRKKSNLKKNKGNRLFLIKWGISSDLFIKHYLKSNTPYNGPLLDKPIKNINFLLLLFICKIKYFFLQMFFK
jgi:glycosyltransferase involved in cell wall biosynthesis